MDAHKVANGAVKRACAEGGPSVSGRGEGMLFIVEDPKDYDSSKAVLRTIDELQPGGTVKHSIPYRVGCGYTLFQGEPAILHLCSNLNIPDHFNNSKKHGQSLNLCYFKRLRFYKIKN